MSSQLDVAEDESSATLASEIFQSLRRGIIDGKFLPGQKLRVEKLRETFGVGTAPVREALNRLYTEGVVSHEDHRGFRVAMVSLEDLKDLTRSRCLINELLLKESISRGDRSWEERAIVAYYRLAKEPRWVEDSRASNAKWHSRHREFHLALLSACASNALLKVCEDLFDRVDRYINLANIAQRDRNVDTEHKDILDAAIARDGDQAARLLVSHIMATTDGLLDSSMLIGANNSASHA